MQPPLRLLLRPVLLCVCLACGVLLVIHAHPLQTTIGDLLSASGGCSGTHVCFMGISPGITLMDEARAILQTHPWVGQTEMQGYTQIYWSWSGRQPAYIDADIPGTIIQRGYDSVSLIRVQTRYPYGDVWLSLGEPETGYVSRQATGVLHGIYYVDHALLAINFTPCPASPHDFWNTPAVIQFGSAYVMLDQRYRDRSSAYRAC
jgi:ABC-type xylose transport system permease subunit